MRTTTGALKFIFIFPSAWLFRRMYKLLILYLFCVHICVFVCVCAFVCAEKVNHICGPLVYDKIVRASSKVVDTNKFRKAEERKLI